MTGKETRISLKRKCPNPLFQECIESLYQQARAKKSKSEPMLKEALDSLLKCPLSFKSGSDCAILQGFGPKLCLFLDQHLERLKVFETEQEAKSLLNSKGGQNDSMYDVHSDKSPQTTNIQSSTGTNGNSSQSTEIDPQQQVRSKSPKKSYQPTNRSGGYAILISLLEYAQENQNSSGLTKEGLIEMAQKHSDESFVRPKPGSYYTAWSNMTRLIKKNFVKKSKTKKVVYSLTSLGSSVASLLLKETQNMTTINDIIFKDVAVHEISDKRSNFPSVEVNAINENLFEMPADSYDVILLIDNNEKDSIDTQFTKYTDMKHEYRSLKVGDFTWIAKNNVHEDYELVLPYIVERKRMDDLAASIKDGRFHEQKFRLRKCGLSNVIYLVEKYKSKHSGMPQSTLMQALANTRVQDGFKVHITDSLNDSVQFLAMMTRRLIFKYKHKHLTGSKTEEPATGQLMSFQYLSKSSLKTKSLTVTELFIKLLLQLKGVSVEKALAITSLYRTPSALIRAYQDCSDEKDSQMLLANLKFSDTSRNVGPAVSKNLFYLFHKMQ